MIITAAIVGLGIKAVKAYKARKAEKATEQKPTFAQRVAKELTTGDLKDEKFSNAFDRFDLENDNFSQQFPDLV